YWATWLNGPTLMVHRPGWPGIGDAAGSSTIRPSMSMILQVGVPSEDGTPSAYAVTVMVEDWPARICVTFTRPSPPGSGLQQWRFFRTRRGRVPGSGARPDPSPRRPWPQQPQAQT